MRWGWLLLALVLAGCGGSKKPPKPPPAEPMLAIIQTAPTTYLDGGALDPKDIERRELRCGKVGAPIVPVALPASGRLTTAELTNRLPGIFGQLECISVVFVDGVESPPSNAVAFYCEKNMVGRRCWAGTTTGSL